MGVTDKKYTENSIRTNTGKVFDLKILDPDSICIEDIAHGLSRVARFGGQTDAFYTVAQHSCLVMEMVPDCLRLQALLHDASEAYIGDMPSPFKMLMPDYKVLEDNLMKVIAHKFEFDYPLNFLVKFSDKKILEVEFKNFHDKEYEVFEVWKPDRAKAEFLQRYHQLTNFKYYTK